MKGKDLMIVLGVAIVLLLVIIIGVKVKNNNNNEIDQNTVGQQTQNNVVNNVVEEFVQVQEDGSKVNTSQELTKTKKVDGLEISNIRVVENNNVTQVTAQINNPTSGTLGDFPVDIKVLDKNGKEIATIGGFIDRVAPGATAELNASATVDFANAYDFEIIKK